VIGWSSAGCGRRGKLISLIRSWHPSELSSDPRNRRLSGLCTQAIWVLAAGRNRQSATANQALSGGLGLPWHKTMRFTMADEKKKREAAGSLSRREFEQKVVKRAREDSGFRVRLLKNPKQALKDVFDVEFPADAELLVLEETSTKSYVVLPFESAGLSDSDLEKIAGGAAALNKKLH
jgi:hypothetical protein